jgi:hypothetical protein
VTLPWLYDVVYEYTVVILKFDFCTICGVHGFLCVPSWTYVEVLISMWLSSSQM